MSNSGNQSKPIFASIDIDNVYIYVGDSVRFDYLENEVKNMGCSVRTISSSTHSPSSFASIATGQYPPRTGVASFSDAIADGVESYLDIGSHNTSFINSIFEFATEEHGNDADPIYNVLKTSSVDNEPVGNIDTPFIVLERGPGGHAPYGDFDGTASDYFRSVLNADKNQIRADYQRSIELDVGLFKTRIQTLSDRGLLNNTLIIYTSDHGELLGEGGLLGHNAPMSPELVYIPTVFIHEDISRDEIDSTFHHVDILPTVCDICDVSMDVSQMDGSVQHIRNTKPRPCFWSNQFFSTPIIEGELSYEGVWDSQGGIAYSRSSLPTRLGVLCGKMLKSSKQHYMRRHSLACLKSYLWESRVYGDPEFDEEEAANILSHGKRGEIKTEEAELTEEAQSHLQDLGYLN